MTNDFDQLAVLLRDAIPAPALDADRVIRQAEAAVARRRRVNLTAASMGVLSVTGLIAAAVFAFHGDVGSHPHAVLVGGSPPPQTAVASSTHVDTALQPGPAPPGTGAICPAGLPVPHPPVGRVTRAISRSCGTNLAITTFAVAGPANADTTKRAGGHTAKVVTFIDSYPSPGSSAGWMQLPAPLVDD